MICEICSAMMVEIERDLYECPDCQHVTDCTYEREFDVDGRMWVWVGRYRSAECQRVAAGHMIIFLTDDTTHVRTEGASIDIDKAMGLCELWVRDGIVGSSFMTPKPSNAAQRSVTR